MGMSDKPVIVTLGDSGGLGPELVCRHFTGMLPSRAYLLIGQEAALAAHLERHGDQVFWRRVDSPEAARNAGPGVYLFEPPEIAGLEVAVGRETVSGGKAAGASLEAACSLMLAGFGAALMTCPLSKASLNAAGYAFPGHTEFLAERSGLGRDEVCMHLCGPRLRVSLVTTHPRLRDAPDLVTRDKVLRCLRLTARFVRDIGEDKGPVAVCGLNPHAGEGGLIGDEELREIIPAIKDARKEGIAAAGPFPADTVFFRAAQGEFPAVLAMYHDQGLGPLKLLHFHECVNVTLGLPFVRTSVGHGTGFDLAGTGRADMGSFLEAMRLAELMGDAKAARESRETLSAPTRA